MNTTKLNPQSDSLMSVGFKKFESKRVFSIFYFLFSNILFSNVALIFRLEYGIFCQLKV